jgi:hypothetical protein
MCTVSKGDLPIQITWILTDDSGQEKILTTDDGIVITRTNQRSSMLSIEQVKPHHRGNFTCRVSNKGGKTQYSTYLHINGFYLDPLSFRVFSNHNRPSFPKLSRVQ